MGSRCIPALWPLQFNRMEVFPPILFNRVRISHLWNIPDLCPANILLCAGSRRWKWFPHSLHPTHILYPVWIFRSLESQAHSRCSGTALLPCEIWCLMRLHLTVKTLPHTLHLKGNVNFTFCCELTGLTWAKKLFFFLTLPRFMTSRRPFPRCALGHDKQSSIFFFS